MELKNEQTRKSLATTPAATLALWARDEELLSLIKLIRPDVRHDEEAALIEKVRLKLRNWGAS